MDIPICRPFPGIIPMYKSRNHSTFGEWTSYEETRDFCIVDAVDEYLTNNGPQEKFYGNTN